MRRRCIGRFPSHPTRAKGVSDGLSGAIPTERLPSGLAPISGSLCGMLFRGVPLHRVAFQFYLGCRLLYQSFVQTQRGLRKVLRRIPLQRPVLSAIIYLSGYAATVCSPLKRQKSGRFSCFSVFLQTKVGYTIKINSGPRRNACQRSVFVVKYRLCIQSMEVNDLAEY